MQMMVIRERSLLPYMVRGYLTFRNMTSLKKAKKKFIDWKKLRVIGGRGGNGCGSFRREAHVRFGGPDGGNGGQGGRVLLVADGNIKSLNSLRHHYKAENGRHGEGSNKHGRNGKDTIIKVPLGTVIKVDGEVVGDLWEDDETLLIADGGMGGIGNVGFITSTLQRGKEATDGTNGEDKVIELEMKIIANIGLVGYPNAGKSSLLRALSRAHPRVAPYPFTTLTPNIGIIQTSSLHHVSVADIPGLLEKAHDNYGLGHTFLRHIERCDHLLYVLDGTQPLLDQLKVLENELDLYNDGLSRKAKMVVVNKVDIEGVEEKIRQLNGCISLPIIPISALYRWNIQHLKYFIFDLYRSNDYNNDNKIEFKK